MHQAGLFRQLSDDVTVFLHQQPMLGDDEREQLAARGIALVEGAVTGLEITDDRLTGVRLDTGEVVPVDALAVQTRVTARADLLAPLGLQPADFVVGEHVMGSHVPAGMAGVSSVPGVWVAGNLAEPMAQVMGAATAGLMAGAHINADLVAEDTRAAVAAYRERSVTRV